MKYDKIKKILTSDYSVTVNGAQLGYLLTLLADEQDTLNRVAEKNIADPMAHMAAAANDVVGNCLIREIYRVIGPDFLAFAMHTTPEAITRLMEAKDTEELDKAGNMIRNSGKDKPRGATLN